MEDIIHITYGDLDNKTILENIDGKLEVQTDETIGRTASGALTVIQGGIDITMKEDKGVVSRVVRLLTNEDLNTIVGETIHARQADSNNIISGMNYPVMEAGYLEVMYSGADNCTHQRYTTYNTDIIFTRRFSDTLGWSAWKEIGTGSGGGGISEIPPATETTLGGVIVGSGLAVQTDGTLSIDMATTVEVTPTVVHAGVVEASITIVGNAMHISFAIEEGTLISASESLIEWDTQYVVMDKTHISAPIFGIDGNLYHCVIDEGGSRIYFSSTETITTVTETYVNVNAILTGDFGVPVISADTYEIVPTLVKTGVIDYSLTASGNVMYVSFVLEEGTVLAINESLLEWEAGYIALDKINLPMAILGINGDFYHAIIDEGGNRIYVDGATTTASSNFVNTSFLLDGEHGVQSFSSGGGSVSSVNGVLPDTAGNVQLIATDVGAYTQAESDAKYVDSSGGNIDGDIYVRGQVHSIKNIGDSYIGVEDETNTDAMFMSLNDTHMTLYNKTDVAEGSLISVDRATGGVSSDYFYPKTGGDVNGNVWSVFEEGMTARQFGITDHSTGHDVYLYMYPDKVGFAVQTEAGNPSLFHVDRATGGFTSPFMLALNGEIGSLTNNICDDSSTDLNITTKPFQLAIQNTPNLPVSTTAFSVWTIKNGGGYGSQLAIGVSSGRAFFRGCNSNVWASWSEIATTALYSTEAFNIQNEIIELEIKQDKAIAKGFTGLSEEITGQLFILNSKLEVI